MSVNPVSFRVPINLDGKATPEAVEVIQNHDDAINDLQQAIPSLKSQIDALTTATSSVTNTTENVTSTSTTVITQNVIGAVNNQTGQTAYSTAQSDYGAFILLNDASPIAVTLTAAPAITLPYFTTLLNGGTGTATLTPSSGTINGVSSFALLQNQAVTVIFDGTNFEISPILALPENFSVISHQFLTSYSSSTGAFTAAQPAFSDISGVASPSQLPLPTATTIGGVEAAGPTAHEWINQIDTSGVPHLSQPAFADISGVATTAQIGTGTPAAGEYVDGAAGAWTALPAQPLSGTTGSMGGSAMTVGQTITATATVTGATTSMVAVCSPVTYPGAGFVWSAYVSAANTVTACLTCVLAGTPTASIYEARAF